jgi:hypothetical protein
LVIPNAFRTSSLKLPKPSVSGSYS